MGGTDDPNNLIELTIEEHAEAHRVLWKTHNYLLKKSKQLVFLQSIKRGDPIDC